jgi:hypothetical protein
MPVFTMTLPDPYSLADTFPGWELTAEEVEFGKAMAHYQTRFHRRYPAWSEVLFVMYCLGYRRIAAREDFLEVPPCCVFPSSATSSRTAA